MKKRLDCLFKLLITALILFFAFTTCCPKATAKNQEKGDTELKRKQLDSELGQPGILRVGMEANYAPFNWSQTSNVNGASPIVNSPGEYANGYDLQIAQQIAEALGLKLEVYKIEWDALPVALESKKIDAIIAGMSPTLKRRKQIDFSNSYYNSDIVIVTKKSSPYYGAKQLADFSGAKITGQLNTFHYELISQIPDVNLQTAMQDFPTMISAVLSGKIDGYISERPGALAAAAANRDLAITEFSEGKGFDLGDLSTDIAVGTRKNTDLTTLINDALSNISEHDRKKIMENMVLLNERGESKSFFGQIQDIWQKYGSQFLKGAGNTMVIALISTIIGFLIGLILAIIRTIPKHPHFIFRFLYRLINLIISLYIEVFRGTPMMVQAMLIFYGSKLFFNWDMQSMFAAVFIVSINTGAYLSEVIRGGIMGIDKGQSEAARSLGMNHYQTMTSVVLPQAIRQILPALGNEFVINIKDTSVLNVIAVTELFFVTRSVAGSTYLTFQTFLITSAIYLVLTFLTTRILHLLEHTLSHSNTYTIHTSSTMANN